MNEPDDRAQQDTQHNRKLGARGEEAAVQYLMRCGYEILERNWHCKSGEADIIAMDEDTLVFIEVKTRTSEVAGLPEDAVTPEKRHRYECIAIEYLRQADLGTLPVRFDVIAITVLNPERAFLRHHCNAFARGV